MWPRGAVGLWELDLCTALQVGGSRAGAVELGLGRELRAQFLDGWRNGDFYSFQEGLCQRPFNRFTMIEC